jgi:hypothetical protein
LLLLLLQLLMLDSRHRRRVANGGVPTCLHVRVPAPAGSGRHFPAAAAVLQLEREAASVLLGS